MNILKNSSTLSESVAINLSIKFDFVSEIDLRETYFVDALRILVTYILLFLMLCTIIPIKIFNLLFSYIFRSQ